MFRKYVTIILSIAVMGCLAFGAVLFTHAYPNALPTAWSFVAGAFSRDSVFVETSFGPEVNAAPLSLSRIVENGSVAIDNFTPPKNGTAIHVNLDTKELLFFSDGALLHTFPVLSIGKPGSAWATPAGRYQIDTKEEKHFSSIGGVWMPYSMHFFGNFFIHGWPYYSGGQDVATGYSGGCIRLSTEDAKTLYELAPVGTVVSVVQKEEKETARGPRFLYKTDVRGLPRHVADAYLVADIETGVILLERDIDVARPIASVTKLMTALVSLEVVNQFEETTVSRTAVATNGAAGALIAGEKIRTGELLYPLLLTSSNDAAEVIAEHIGRNRFLAQMNERAHTLGLTDTYYDDPSGLSPQNVSSPRDLFKLARHLYQNKNYVFERTLLKSHTDPADTHTWRNNNPFIRNGAHSQYRGGKHGYIPEAGHTFIGIFELPLGEFETRMIAIALLDTGDWQASVAQIKQFLLDNIYYSAPTDPFAPIEAVVE